MVLGRRGATAAGDEETVVDLHWNLSLSLLQAGDYLDGFREYEWRWKTPTFAEFLRDTVELS